MFITVLYGDHEQALFNIQCQTVLLLDCIKHNCHCENEEEIDLADKSGQVKNLSQNERRYASEVLNEREELILISVSRSSGSSPVYTPMLNDRDLGSKFLTTLGNKGDTKVTLNRTKKLSRKNPSSPSSPGADGKHGSSPQRTSAVPHPVSRTKHRRN